MLGSLVEDGSLTSADFIADNARLSLGVEDAGFGNGFGLDAAGHDGKELGGSGLSVKHDHRAA